jgi:hypothetical protein
MNAKQYQRLYGGGRTPAFVAESDAATAKAQRGPSRTAFAPPPTYTAYVGIDPGQSTGVALLVRGQALQVLTVDFWATVGFLAATQAQHPALLVVIEDPNLDRSLYARYDAVQGAARTKVAQNVGANKRDAQLLLAWCERAGIATRAVRPPGKLTPQAFAALTGIAKCSQHARDAAHLLMPYLPQRTR